MNRWSAVLFAAFGLRGVYRDAERQIAALGEVRAVAQRLSAPQADAVNSATEEAGSFHREK